MKSQNCHKYFTDNIWKNRIIDQFGLLTLFKKHLFRSLSLFSVHAVKAIKDVSLILRHHFWLWLPSMSRVMVYYNKNWFSRSLALTVEHINNNLLYLSIFDINNLYIFPVYSYYFCLPFIYVVNRKLSLRLI